MSTSAPAGSLLDVVPASSEGPQRIRKLLGMLEDKFGHAEQLKLVDQVRKGALTFPK